jgi:hypothetical protein
MTNASRSDAMLVAVDFSPRKSIQAWPSRNDVCSVAMGQANVATRRPLPDAIPWTEVHGYLHSIAPRYEETAMLYRDFSESQFNLTSSKLRMMNEPLPVFRRDGAGAGHIGA